MNETEQTMETLQIEVACLAFDVRQLQDDVRFLSLRINKRISDLLSLIAREIALLPERAPNRV